MRTPPSAAVLKIAGPLSACAALVFLSALRGQAQSAPSATPNSAQPSTANRGADSTIEPPPVVALPPFEVRTDQDQGYAAQNTTSGSRLNTNLADTPAAISVFTKELIEDIAATDLEGIAEYAINTRNNLLDGGRGSLTNNDPIIEVRGISAGGGGGRFTNFFKSSITQDTFNMERTELTRGPNSVLFGVGQPSGGFNVATKKADVRQPRREVSYRLGSHQQSRTTLDLNHPLVGNKLALRLNAVYEDRNDWRAFAYRNDQRWQLAGRWQLAANTRLDVEFEHGNRNYATPSQAGVLDSLTPWIAAGRKIDTTPGHPTAPPAAVTAANAALAAGGMQLVSTGNSLVYDTTSGIVYNVARQSVSAPAGETPGLPAVAGEDNPMIFDFDLVPREVFLGGPAYGTSNRFTRTTATFSHELIKNLFLEAAFNREVVHNFSREVLPRTIQVDTNAFLPGGAANPNAGRTYAEQILSLRNRDTAADDLRFTASYDYDFTVRPQGVARWLGRHRLAALYLTRDDAQYSDQQQEFLIENPLVTTTPDNNANRLRRRTYFDLDGPVGLIGLADYRLFPANGLVSQFNNLPIQTAFLPFGQPRDTLEKTITNLYVWQASLLRERLVGTFGYRRDRIRSFDSTASRGPAFGPFAQGVLFPTRNADPSFGSGITRTQGFVAKPLTWLSVFYNHSSSFSLPARTVRVFPDVPSPSAQGETHDLGVKLPLFRNRVFATITYYETSADNQSENTGVGTYVTALNNIWTTLDNAGVLAATGRTLDAERVFANGTTFDRKAKGWEFEFTANPTPNWRLILNFSTNQTIQRDTALELRDYYATHAAFFTEGTRGQLIVNGMPGQLAARAIDATDGVTTIAEQLQSNSISIDDTFVKPDGARQLGAPVAAGNLRTSYTHRAGFLKGVSWGGGARWRGERVLGYTTSEPATREEIRGAATLTVDANITYRRKAGLFGRKLDLTFQLNVNNVLDDDDLIITRTFADGRPRSFSFPVPRQWYLTTTFKF